MGPKGAVEGNISQANKLKYCLMEKQSKYIPFVLIMLILAGLFYWFEWRPTQIRKECYKQAEAEEKAYLELTKASLPTKTINGPTYLNLHPRDKTLEENYRDCLLQNGLSK